MFKHHTEVVIGAILVFTAGIICGTHIFNSMTLDQGGLAASASATKLKPAATAATNVTNPKAAPAPVSTLTPMPSSVSSVTTQSAQPTVADAAVATPPLMSLVEGTESVLIRDLQNRLGQAGFFEGKATGYFGTKTKAALMAFQKAHSVSITGIVDNKTAELLVSHQAQGSEMCSAQSGAADWHPPQFPPHGPGDVVPPLPPLDTTPLNDAPPTNPDRYMCTDKANHMCDAYHQLFPGVNCSILTTGGHAINIIWFTDSNGVRQVCVIEPQNNQYICMTEEQWNNLPDGWQYWVKHVLCPLYPAGTCDPDDNPAIIPMPLLSCPADAPNGGYSSSCPSGLTSMCISSNGNAVDLFCTGSNVCPDSGPHGDGDELVPFWKSKKILCYYAEPVFVPQENQ